MAIVLRSERNFNSSLINNNSVGPGQYKIQNYFDKNDALNQNNVPFNTSEERIFFLKMTLLVQALILKIIIIKVNFSEKREKQ